MSAVEFALTQPSFLTALPPQTFEPSLAASESLAARYAGLAQLSRSTGMMTPEMLSSNLVALLRPLFAVDFANLIIFGETN